MTSLINYFSNRFISDEIKQPEDSITLRVIAFLAQLVSAVCLSYVTQLWFLIPISTVVLSVAHVYAYFFRNNPQKWVRNIGFVALHLGFCGLVLAIARGIPYPQAQFAVLVMAFVSVEVFSRLNLYSAFGFGFVNLYAAATLSRDIYYGGFLLVFIALLLAFMWRADSEDGVKKNPHILKAEGEMTKRPRLSIGGWLWRFGVVGIVLAGIVFIFTPHYSARPLFMPISLTAPIETKPQKSVINPAVPLVQIEGRVEDTNQTSEYYFGFADSLDLSYRGGLSDTLMMYVSSGAWSYWRGYAYDAYDGRAWYQSVDEVDEIEPDGRAFFQLEEPPHQDTFVASFYIQQDLPNIVWTAGNPVEVFFPAERLGADQTDGLRVGTELKEGLFYSIVAERVDFDPDELRSASGLLNPRYWNYLQLPDTVTERTRELAADITEGLDNNYDKSVAIRDYLLQFEYDFFPPPLAPNADAVDQFLFVDQRGFCEIYVSSMVVMLRSLGIPARFVVGFGSGDYNRFTGYYEVRANDAHAWVEVYFPDYGWVPFDPTPGWEGNPETGPVQRWVFSDALSNVDLPTVSLGAMGEVGAAVAGALSVPALILGSIAGVMGAAYGAYRGWLWWLARRSTRYHDDPTRREIFREYRRIQRKLKTQRSVGQTVQEHAREHPELKDIADTVDIAAYRPTPPEPSLLEKLRAWWDRR